MSYSTTPTTQKALKSHLCSWCGQTIKAGESYKRYRWFNGGDAGTSKFHPECHEAMESESAEQGGGWFEWVAGYERPPKIGVTA
jgi:hypothetical protein